MPTKSVHGPSNEEMLEMFILDVLRHDIESLPHILELLNSRSCLGWRFYWPHDFTGPEVTGALSRLVDRKLVVPLLANSAKKALEDSAEFDSKRISDYWFRLTDAGREAWERWTPPVESGNSQ